MKIPVRSRSSNREKSRKRRLDLTGKPLRRGSREPAKGKFSSEEHVPEGRDQDCSEELSLLLRTVSGGRRIYDTDAFKLEEDQHIL